MSNPGTGAHRIKQVGACLVVAAAALVPGLSACGQNTKVDEKDALAFCDQTLAGDRQEDALESPDGFAVATSDPYASWAACRTLAQGGSAADGAAAAELTLGLTEPQSSGPGGGSVAMVYDSAKDKTFSLDGTVYSPAGYQQTEDAAARVGVPTTLQTLRQLNRLYGKVSLGTAVQPAADLAANGFHASERLASAVDAAKESGVGAKLYNRPDGIAPGDELTNTAYADALSTWGDNKGKWSSSDIDKFAAELNEQTDDPAKDRLIDTWVQDRNGLPEKRDSLCTSFGNASVCGINSPAVGSNIVLPALGILNHLGLDRLTPYDNSGIKVARATAAHLIIEAERLAFTEANTWMGDPGSDQDLRKIAGAYRDQVVLNDGFYGDSADEIHQKQSIRSPEPTKLSNAPYQDFFEEGTTHVSVRDTRGNIVSMTSTLQSKFGSGLVVGGFPLNNSLDNFNGKDAAAPNSAAELRHPKTTMSPLIVQDGKNVTAVGSPGGTNIPSYDVKSVVSLQAWGLTPEEAIRMPNFGATTRSAAYVENSDYAESLPDVDRMKKCLKKWGHEVNNDRADSGTNIVSDSADGLWAAADPRRDGAVQGYSL